MAGADDKLVNDYLRKHVADPWKRGNVLPIARNMQTGELAPAVPEGVRSLVNSVLGFITTDPRDPASGRISDEAVAGSTDFVSMLAGGGVTAGLRHGVKAALDPTVASVFVKPAPAAIDAAEAAVSKGATRRQLWDDLGVFKGRDGNWRREIDDSPAAITDYWAHRPDGSFGNDANIRNMIGRYEATEAPELEGLYAKVRQDPRAHGTFVEHLLLPQHSTLNAAGPTPADALSVLLHEFQHGAQRAYGFKNGWNPLRHGDTPEVRGVIDDVEKARLSTLAETGRFRNSASTTPDDIDLALMMSRPQLAQQKRATDLMDGVLDGDGIPRPEWVRYLFDAGETEARNVQTRHRLATQNGVDLRTLPPWHTQDVPYTWQFLR